MWIVILLLGIAILVLSITLFTGHGGWLIKSYRSLMGAEEGGGIDGKLLLRVMGAYTLLVALGIFALMLSNRLPWVVWVFPALAVAATVCLVVWVGRGGPGR